MFEGASQELPFSEFLMPASKTKTTVPLPKSWSSHVKSAILQVISLAQYTIAYTRGWAADSPNTRMRLKTELERATQEIGLLREEIRIKDVRMGQLPPHRRPYYPSTERMAVLSSVPPGIGHLGRRQKHFW